MKRFNLISNPIDVFLLNVFIAGGLVDCLIAEDLADLANHLTNYQCKVLQSVMTNKTIGLIKSPCFDFLISQRVQMRTKYPRDGDRYFKRNLTGALTDLGLSGSAMKLIRLDLREKIFSMSVNKLSRLEEIRVKAETDADDHVGKNPFKAMYSSSSRRHERLIQESNQKALDVTIFTSVITLAIILTYILIVTVRNLDVSDDLIDRDEVVFKM